MSRCGCSRFRTPPLGWSLVVYSALPPHKPVLRVGAYYTGQRVDFKIATLVHRSLSGNLSSYLAGDCQLIADAREQRLYATRRAEHASFHGPTAPLVTELLQLPAPRLWNSLPSHLRDADLSYSRSRGSLKTFLFGQWGHGAVRTFLTAPPKIILLTYLLYNFNG